MRMCWRKRSGRRAGASGRSSPGPPSRRSKQALRAQTDQAQALGIFGAPTLITESGELFWGDDRLEQALAGVRGAQRLDLDEFTTLHHVAIASFTPASGRPS